MSTEESSLRKFYFVCYVIPSSPPNRKGESKDNEVSREDACEMRDVLVFCKQSIQAMWTEMGFLPPNKQLDHSDLVEIPSEVSSISCSSMQVIMLPSSPVNPLVVVLSHMFVSKHHSLQLFDAYQMLSALPICQLTIC